MLIQRAGTGTLPPPGFTPPPWSLLSAQWDAMPLPSTPTVTLGPKELVMGHSDRESYDLHPVYTPDSSEAMKDYAEAKYEREIAEHEYGWDNESPLRLVDVAAFRAEWRPITNGEFLKFWREQDGYVDLPASWVEEDGEVKVTYTRFDLP